MVTFLFPLKGVYFLLTHPKQLWLKTFSPIILTVVFSFFSIGFSIQVILPKLVEKFLEWHWPHWMSWFVSIVSTIVQGALVNLIFFAILVPIFQDAVFDATLKARGLQRIFDEEEALDIPKYIVCWRNLRSSVLIKWCLIMTKIILMVLTAPLQLIPFAGTALACVINGWPTAWSQHVHYDIELRGNRVRDSYRRAWDHKGNYISFGSIAFALEMIPIFNILFIWTNVVAAGLWIADEYEKEKGITNKSANGNKSRDIYPVAQPPNTSSERTPLLQQNEDYDA